MTLVLKILISIFFLIVAFWPTWLFLLVKYLLAPDGFWQNLILFGVGFYFLGFLQIFSLIVWSGVIIKFFEEL